VGMTCDALDLIEAARAAGVKLRPRLWAEPVDRLPAELRLQLRTAEVEVISALIGNARPLGGVPVREDEFGPVIACPRCGSGSWWRASALSGSPGPWSCADCDPAAVHVWRDGCAVPVSPPSQNRGG
jgi:hypothetical protein